MARHLEEGDDVVLIASELTLRFFWTGDRWARSIESQGRRLAVSLEGDHAPAFQQIHVHEESPGRLAALLVGQSGTHHYSASFQIVETPSRTEILADLADRCRDRPADKRFAATYLTEMNSSDLASADHQSATWRPEVFSSPRLEIEFATTPGQGSISVSEAGRRGWRLQALGEPTPDSATHRCRYAWIARCPETASNQDQGPRTIDP